MLCVVIDAPGLTYYGTQLPVTVHIHIAHCAQHIANDPLYTIVNHKHLYPCTKRKCSQIEPQFKLKSWKNQLEEILLSRSACPNGLAESY